MPHEAQAFDQVVLERRSVRGFLPQPVPQELIVGALHIAQRSPSNCNAQPWHVTIAAGERCQRLREKLVSAYQTGRPTVAKPTPAFSGEYRTRQLACAAELYGAMGVARDDKLARRAAEQRNFEFFGAPCVAILGMDATFGIGVALDVGAFLQTFMLALAARGIASCPQASLRAYADLISEELNLDPRLQILCGISLGYPDPNVAANRARMPRAALEESCTLLGFEEETARG